VTLVLVSVRVRVRARVSGMVSAAAQTAVPPEEEDEAEHDEEKTRDQAEDDDRHVLERSRRTRRGARDPVHDDTDREDGERVGERRETAEESRIAHAPAGAAQVRGDHALSVAREEGMRDAPEDGRGEDRDERPTVRGIGLEDRAAEGAEDRIFARAI